MIESDGDLHGALISFLEVARTGNNAVQYQTLHIEECVEVMMQRDKNTEPLETCSSSKRPSTDADGQAAKRPKHVRYQWTYNTYSQSLNNLLYMYACACMVSACMVSAYINCLS